MSNKYKLEVSLPSETEILLVRKFDFPANLIYKYFADNTTHSDWVGCDFGTVTESYGKPEIGAPWSFKLEVEGQGEFHMFGQCLEVVPNERLVRTFIYNVPMIRENPSVEIATFTESDGVTTLEVLVRHLSQANRDGQLESGMEMGAGSTYDALERMLEAQQVAS